MKGFESMCKSFFCCSMVAILTVFFFPYLGEASSYSITDLYAGTGDFYVNGINDSNQIISFNYGNGESYIIEDSVYTPFNLPGVYGTYASAINNDGDIAGYYKPAISTNPIGFFWDGTKADILPTGATSSYVYGMNDADKTVGLYYPPNFPSFVSDGTTFNDIIIPGAGRTFAMDINNNGEILGGYYDTSNTWHNYILDGSNLEILSLLDGHRAAGFNDLGQIVGRYTAIDGTMTAYIYDMIADTYTYIGNSTDTGWIAEDINNEGVVVGWYRPIVAGRTVPIHGFVATADPVPEPSTILLLGSGLAGLAVYRKKRK